MKTYSTDELKEVLAKHRKWVFGEDGGSRADLSGADLSRAYLSRAYLSGAVHAWAQVAFKGHGERGRMLTAVIYMEGGEAVYQCGCFSGSLAELTTYINTRTDKDGSGIAEYIKSRTLAMEVVTQLLAV